MNAKTELLEFLEDKPTVAAAVVSFGVVYDEENLERFVLPLNYTDDHRWDFFDSLDFEYDDGYGTQMLAGTIWFTDGTWAQRGEYDGSEWWEYCKCPELVKEVM